MARYFCRKVTPRRNAVANCALASLAVAISAFQFLAPFVRAGFAAISPARPRVGERSSMNDVCNCRRRQRSRQSGALPRGVFDPLFSGLSADAARIDAAICRRTRIR